MFAPKSEKSHGGHRKEKQKNTKKREKEKKRKKEIKKGATLLLFIHTCAHVIAPVVFIVIICAHV